MGEVLKIFLGRNKEFFTEVDDEDFIWLSKYQWSARKPSQADKSAGIYATRRTHSIYMHREIMGVLGSDGIVDHIDGNTLNNRRSNLRICTLSDNSQNRKSNKGSSKFQGVYWDKFNEKWRVQISRNNKMYTFGRFTDEILAAKVYDENALKLFGSNAKLNFPNGKAL